MINLKVYIDKILHTLMTVLFLMMLGMTSLNVFMRFFLNNPIVYAVEFGRYCFVAIIYLGAIYVMREDGHIGLDMIVNNMSVKLRRIINILNKVLVDIFLLIFIYCSINMVKNGIGVKSSSMGISMAIPYFAMVIGSVGMIIENTLNILNPSRIMIDTIVEEMK